MIWFYLHFKNTILELLWKVNWRGWKTSKLDIYSPGKRPGAESKQSSGKWAARINDEQQTAEASRCSPRALPRAPGTPRHASISALTPGTVITRLLNIVFLKIENVSLLFFFFFFYKLTFYFITQFKSQWNIRDVLASWETNLNKRRKMGPINRCGSLSSKEIGFFVKSYIWQDNFLY